MNNYYSIGGKNYSQVARANAPQEVEISTIVIRELKGVNELPFELTLIKSTITKNGLLESADLDGIKDIWLDYMPNSLAFPMFSERMREIIDHNLTGNENIDWITAKINGNNEDRTYYILRFNKVLDVLNYDKTSFIEDTDYVIIPTFELAKIHNYSIFHIPSSDHLCSITTQIYINETLKNQLQKGKLIGLNFEKVSAHRIT